ncbi:MAG TPA: ATP-grasp domain-containing protein [Gemmatimonadales bacterium]|nr:ATP-grasp domain-containing protein [Gemmatimonadales bacterium]
MKRFGHAVAAADPRPLLIAAVSGRALAASAARAGRAALVLDLFGDRDTRSVALESRVVSVPGAPRLDPARLLAAAEELAPAGRISGLVYGSGFEGQPDLLEQLARNRPLFGNSPEAVRLVRDPKRLFPLLDGLGIAYPAISHRPPTDPRGWLMKDPGGAGGAHIRVAGDPAPGGAHYYQRLEIGRNLSALFLADGRRAQVIGLNEQWTSPARANAPFLFGGVVGRVRIASGVFEGLSAQLDRLVAEAGLVGLNGVDLLLGDRGWLLLEVNPRPTASMELYDADLPKGLLEAHLEACRGMLPERPPAGGPSRALAVVYAPKRWEVPEECVFPEWCRDLPVGGTRCAPGDPVCTVHAEDATPAVAMRVAQERAERVRSLIRSAGAAVV